MEKFKMVKQKKIRVYHAIREKLHQTGCALDSKTKDLIDSEQILLLISQS